MLHTLIVSVLMFFGQVHFCQPEYVLPSGDTCFTCPELIDSDRSEAPAVTTASHGDCHDCCTLKPCDDTGKSKIQAASTGFSVEIAALPNLPELRIQRAPITFAPIPFVDSCPPTGPPSTASSRGPPCSQQR